MDLEDVMVKMVVTNIELGRRTQVLRYGKWRRLLTTSFITIWQGKFITKKENYIVIMLKSKTVAPPNRSL